MHAGLEDPGLEDLGAVRQEMLALLRQQMDALDSPQGLTHDQLRECYGRQTRILELRDRLQAASNPDQEAQLASQATREMAAREPCFS
jgi:hypothetical protein